MLLTAKRSTRAAGPTALRFSLGQAWTVRDNFMAQIPDPQTGKVLTPTAGGLFNYTVEKLYPNAFALISMETKELRSGISPEQLKLVPIPADKKPIVSFLVMTPSGFVYGPYPKADGAELKETSDIEAWLRLAGRSVKFFFYKLPSRGLKEGEQLRLQAGRDIWAVRRMPDEKGLQIYRAYTARDKVRVDETLWLDARRGAVVKRQVSEKRGKGLNAVLVQQVVMR